MTPFGPGLDVADGVVVLIVGVDKNILVLFIDLKVGSDEKLKLNEWSLKFQLSIHPS